MCPCVKAREGVFVLATCFYAACWSHVFLGADFVTLLAEFVHAPLDPPLAFAIWAAILAIGVAMLVAGIRENLQDHHGAPFLPSLGTILACVAAMHHGWYLPAGIAAIAPLLSHGLYVALIAACCANLVMALVAWVRRTWIASASPEPMGVLDGTALAEYREVLAAYVERDARYQRALKEATQRIKTLELAVARSSQLERIDREIGAENSDMQAVLKFPGVRSALLHALHSDHHAGESMNERHVRDELLAKLLAIYTRIGTKAAR